MVWARILKTFFSCLCVILSLVHLYLLKKDAAHIGIGIGIGVSRVVILFSLTFLLCEVFQLTSNKVLLVPDCDLLIPHNLAVFLMVILFWQDSGL